MNTLKHFHGISSFTTQNGRRLRRHLTQILAVMLVLPWGLGGIAEAACNAPSFAAVVTFAAGGSPTGITAGDLNGDTRTDLVISNQATNNVSVLIGNGMGGFAAAVNVTVGTSPSSTAIADFNGDMRPDIAAANSGTNNVSLLAQNAMGGYAAAVNTAVGTSPTTIATGDFNKDGRTDVATANYLTNNVSVLITNAPGAMTPFAAAANTNVGTSPVNIVARDLNGDTNLDLATANFGSKNVSVLIGNGMGGFAAAVNYAAGSSTYSLAVGDLNGDNRLDIVTVNLGSVSGMDAGGVSVLLANATGAGYAAAVNYVAGSVPSFIAVGDVNGDTRIDIITANYASNNLSILLGDGTGKLGAATHLAVGSSPHAVVVRDLNGDTKPDLASANLGGSANVSVLLNTCP